MPASTIRILVVIASYGNTNDNFLLRVLEEYRRLPYKTDIVVISNLAKDLGPDVEVVVSVPDGDPWSLPFAHKKILAQRLNDYDLFIYSEDDILVTARNIEAFLRLTPLLPQDKIAGFLRIETDPDGKVYYIDAHSHYHWDPASLLVCGPQAFAYFTNEHAALYLLTREQLRLAIESGGFLVEPHSERYDLLVSAATDPYTQCGLKKMICVSQLEDFSVLHLPNKKYKGRTYAEKEEFRRQIDALMEISSNGHARKKLFDANPKIGLGKWSKSYYEPHDPFSDGRPSNDDILSCLPKRARSVLSIGCGWGATEALLVEQGIRVVAVPLDPVIGACARAKGVEVVEADFATAKGALSNERFDCILMSHVLHLVPNPVQILSSFNELLRSEGTILAIVPNFGQLSVLWRRLCRHPMYMKLGNYRETGIHLTSHRRLKKWFRESGFKIERTINFLSPRARVSRRLTLGLGTQLLASEFIAVGKKE